MTNDWGWQPDSARKLRDEALTHIGHNVRYYIKSARSSCCAYDKWAPVIVRLYVYSIPRFIFAHNTDSNTATDQGYYETNSTANYWSDIPGSH